MDGSPKSPVTQLLNRIVDGSPHAASELFPLVYDELHTIALGILRDDERARTLQPTALVHEAFIKLSGAAEWDWRGKARFASLAAGAMRQILVDHVRGKGRQKRSDQRQRITLQGVMIDDSPQTLDLLDLEDALNRLAENFPRPARVVEFRFFAGMNREEIAEVLGVTIRTVNTDLALAQAWLLRELDRGCSDDRER